MFVTVLLFLLGLAMIIKGGDWFVDGACGVARRFHLPELLIGATIVSIGTTLPEVLVSATSAVAGNGAMAYGNAVGSVICNTTLIAALTITVAPSVVDRRPLKMPVAFFFGTAAFYLAISYTTGSFNRLVGAALLASYLAYMVLSVVSVKKELKLSAVSSAAGEDKPASPLWKDLLLLVVGAVMIAVAARLLVDNGQKIAEALGVPDSVIALTFVALGTSLPELVTAITSLVKGHGSLSLGNIIGANFFDLALVCGISALVRPFDIPTEKLLFGVNASLLVELPLMAAGMGILTLPPLFTGKLTRAAGIAMLVLYAGFCVVQFVL